MKQYAIGVDFGTLSARGILLDLADGTEKAESEYMYPHGILGEEFFGDKMPKEETALQHPKDYTDALGFIVKDILKKARINREEIAGIGFDFTSCTVLPVTSDGTPLCYLEKYEKNPHAYVKLWKHQSAQKEADAITLLAEKEGDGLLERYGGKVSSEWIFPKLLEILHKAPDVYADTVRFLEAADWLVWQITGREVHASCMAGYKGMWNKKNGYPSNAFWAKLDERLCDIIGTKIAKDVVPTGTKAGEINAYGSDLTGLGRSTTVAVPIIDAHATLPGAGITEPGKMMLILGTSACHIVLGEEEKPVPGICGSVEDGIIPGLVAYEAGQNATGDTLDWFVKNCVPEKYMTEARKEGKSIFALLDEKAASVGIGESGVLVLDWWNGNRTPFADYDLSGMIVGLTLCTKPEEIYRAIMEATAFGTKAIVELYQTHGVPIEEVYASGGIAQKNEFMMQLYADVIGKEICVVQTKQAGARGSAILAAVASGYFASVKDAVFVMGETCLKIYTPNLKNTAQYDKLYAEYKQLSDVFGKANSVMHRLRQ